MPLKEMVEYVTIHGDKWKSIDIKESIDWALEQSWQKQEWKPRAALVSKGSMSEFVGQKYNPEHSQLVEDGWSHDHCVICWWSLHESSEPEHGEGFTTNGRKWLCTECYSQFIAKKV